MSSVLLTLMALNVLIGSAGFLEILFFLAVGQPIGTFIRAIGDLHHSGETLTEQT